MGRGCREEHRREEKRTGARTGQLDEVLLDGRLELRLRLLLLLLLIVLLLLLLVLLAQIEQRCHYVLYFVSITIMCFSGVDHSHSLTDRTYSLTTRNVRPHALHSGTCLVLFLRGRRLCIGCRLSGRELLGGRELRLFARLLRRLCRLLFCLLLQSLCKHIVSIDILFLSQSIWCSVRGSDYTAAHRDSAA